MKTVVLSALAISIAVSLVACGGGGPGATPKDTFETMKGLAEKKDFEGMWDILSPASTKNIEEEWGKMKSGWAEVPADMKAEMEAKVGDPSKFGSAKEFFLDMARRNEAESTAVGKGVFVEAKEEGDKATVKYKVGDKDEEMQFVKVDGKWYVSFE